MKTLIAQNLTHRGTVAAAGFWFSAKLLPENEMRRRVLAVWQTGARVYRYHNDLIAVLPESTLVDCRRAIGSPLVKYDDIIASFPLRKIDLELFRDSGETIVRLDEGRIETIAIGDLTLENVEDWFDVSAFQIVETETLGAVKTKPLVVEKTEAIDLRTELKDVPAANAELTEILQTLKRKKEEIAKARNDQTLSNADYSNAFPGNFGGVFDWVKNLFVVKDGQGWQPLDQQPKPPNKLRRAFTKALFQMKIGQMLGRKQARYLSEMIEMFESGDLDRALKHAIPLEDMQALKEMSEQMPFLGLLRPRQNLRIDYGRQTATGSAVHLDDQWFAHLRELYRQTFDRLVAQNRVEEAAFVLAELLKSNHEAVEFLEKHGKFRLAAEFAEARDLPKDVVVRQWFLAGEKRRAVQTAVLHNCFEYVAAKLEQQNHPQAADLREVWAESLAASGNFSAAINTIWQLENRRQIAVEWIDRTIEFGGAPAAQMLAKKIVLLPESYAEVKTKLLEIIGENDADGKEQRAAFARETLRSTANAELRMLARPLARKILADTENGDRRFSPQEFRQLIDISGDYALRADLPKLSEIVGKKTAETFSLEIAAADRGANRIYDAHLLPDGKIAVALGEAGVKIVSKHGKTIDHFDQPTERFVVSDFGTRAICLAERGEIYRLAKIDFVTRKAAYWCDAKIENYARSFDGNLWFVSEKADVYAIDANQKNFEAAWRVADIGGQVYEISRSKTKLLLLVANEKGIEKWWYDLPQFVLRSRNQTKWFEMENENQTIDSVSSFVAYSIVQVAETVEESTNYEARIYDYDARMTKFRFSDETTLIKKPLIVEKTFALSSRTESGAVVGLYEIPATRIAEFKISNAGDFSVRLDANFLTITDDAGRVLVFDYQQKILRKNLRI